MQSFKLQGQQKKKGVVFNTTVTPKEPHCQGCTWPQQSSSKQKSLCSYRGYYIFKYFAATSYSRFNGQKACGWGTQSGGFGQKHSDVSFTYWRTVLVIKN